MPDETLRFLETYIEIYHLNTSSVKIRFNSANDIAGNIVKFSLLPFPKSANNHNYLELSTSELDFSELEPGNYEVIRDISIYAPETPSMSSYDQILAMFDLYKLFASVNDEVIGSDTIIIKENLIQVECTTSPSVINLDSLSEINFTLEVKITPPPASVLPIRLGSPAAGSGIAIAHQTSETIFEDGLLKAQVRMELQDFPEFFFEEERFYGDTYIVEVGDVLGYRKRWYWTTTVGIKFGPFTKSLLN